MGVLCLCLYLSESLIAGLFLEKEHFCIEALPFIDVRNLNTAVLSLSWSRKPGNRSKPEFALFIFLAPLDVSRAPSNPVKKPSLCVGSELFGSESRVPNITCRTCYICSLIRYHSSVTCFHPGELQSHSSRENVKEATNCRTPSPTYDVTRC